MSNCIEIDNPVVEFPASVIDFAKVREMVELGNSVPDDYDHDKITNVEYFTYWFFNSRNVQLFDDKVVVRFGRGRSSLTNRDFTGLLMYVIEPCMKQPFKWVLKIRDECDGFRSVCPCEIDFQNPRY